MDGSFERIGGAGTYLKYVDFSSPLISSVETDGDGSAIHSLPGNTTLMRGLFILVMEKDGFRSKEVHFDIAPCYSNYTFPSRPAQEEPLQNESEPEEEIADEPVVPANESPPEMIEETEEEDGETPAPSVCPLSFVVLLMFYKAIKR